MEATRTIASKLIADGPRFRLAGPFAFPRKRADRLQQESWARTVLCTEAGSREPAEVAHTLGLIIDGAIVAALITRNTGVADTAGRACAVIVSGART